MSTITLTIQNLTNLYQSYVDQINSILVIFTIIIALGGLWGFVGLRSMIKDTIEKKVQQEIDSDEVRKLMIAVAEDVATEHTEVILEVVRENYTDKKRGIKYD